ncbi:phage tail protein [Ignatzschineria rhizosphaerae]|uniref:Phage tail protein n=1 Tax=Ignatzschineria rhizosphaerae TaxID=2923279 RepID=A0ABY3X4J4_9GAMM|nr:phage tail protein [Ignatzschineria rhizosphaerae]UNM95962.1 phage tail protein [Ignatzschineria rhizosphaerae]
MEVFRWCPLRDPEPEIEYDEAVKEVSFGDGYEQVSPDGLNAKRRTFKNFTYSEDADQVLAFFMRHGKSKAFLLDIKGHKATVRFSEAPKESLTTEKLTIEMKEVFR